MEDVVDPFTSPANVLKNFPTALKSAHIDMVALALAPAAESPLVGSLAENDVRRQMVRLKLQAVAWRYFLRYRRYVQLCCVEFRDEDKPYWRKVPRSPGDDTPT